jgi:hypothetical protein
MAVITPLLVFLKEIGNCKRLSLGPNFVLFLGQKYGYRKDSLAFRYHG